MEEAIQSKTFFWTSSKSFNSAKLKFLDIFSFMERIYLAVKSFSSKIAAIFEIFSCSWDGEFFSLISSASLPTVSARVFNSLDSISVFMGEEL